MVWAVSGQETEVAATSEAPDKAARTARHFLPFYESLAPDGLHHRRVAPKDLPVSVSTNQVPLDVLTNVGVIHLEMGLHYLDESGNLLESNPVIEASPEGAVLRGSAITAAFSDDITAVSAIDITTAEGTRLRGGPLGLSYYDPVSGASVMIAEVKSSKGRIVPPNKVIYEDIFDAVKASAVYEVTREGIMQSIVLEEDPPAPGQFSLPEDSSRLEVLTEFLDAPQPVKRVRVLRKEADEQKREGMQQPDFLDETLQFGNAIMRPGIAFALPEGAEDLESVRQQPVGKHWEDLPAESRSVLFESVEYRAVKDALNKLEPSASEDSKPTASRERRIPAKRVALLDKKPMQVALAGGTRRGMVIDYSIVNSITTMTFHSGETYYVTNTVNITHATFNPACVIKYARNAKLSISGTATFNGTIAHPSIFTGYDDDSYGDRILAVGGLPASTGHPTGIYAARAIELFGPDVATTIQKVKIRLAGAAVYISGTAGTFTHVVKESRFEDSTTALSLDNAVANFLDSDLCNVTNTTVLTNGASAVVSSNVVADCTGGYVEIPYNSMWTTNSSYWPITNPDSQGYDWHSYLATDRSIEEPIWHAGPLTRYSTNEWIRFEFQEDRFVGKIQYYPRFYYYGTPYPAIFNGTVLNYRLFVTTNSSMLMTNWGAPVAVGTLDWSYGPEVKTIEFAPKLGRYFILQCSEGYNGWAAAGEIWIYENIDARVATPQFSPAGQSYTGYWPTTVQITTATAGATIRYSTNYWVDPDENSTLYTGPITLTNSVHNFFRARAYAPGMGASYFNQQFLSLYGPNPYTMLSNTVLTADASSFWPGNVSPANGTNFTASLAVNGSTAPDAYWHSGPSTQYSTNEWLRVDLGAQHWVGQVGFWPRGSLYWWSNPGFPGAFEIYVTDSASTNIANWGAPVHTGYWYAEGIKRYTAGFDGKVGRYVIMRWLSGYGGWAAASEIEIYKITDNDADGMPDAWEYSYFGNVSRNGSGDFDGDGYTDLQEFQNKTDPKLWNGFAVYTPLK